MPIRPKALTKGSLSRVPAAAPHESVVFQYNPETIVRRLQFSGSITPSETIEFTLVLDGTERLERADTSPMVGPGMAALELFMCAQSGTSSAPMLNLSLGPDRQVPVRLVNIVVTEQLFSATLEPLRASVDLTLEVVGREDATRDEESELVTAYLLAREQRAARVGD